MPLTIVLDNSAYYGTLLNFGKRYEDNLRVIFDQWPKLHLGLDALSNRKILNGIYLACYQSNLIMTNFECWILRNICFDFSNTFFFYCSKLRRKKVLFVKVFFEPIRYLISQFWVVEKKNRKSRQILQNIQYSSFVIIKSTYVIYQGHYITETIRN